MAFDVGKHHLVPKHVKVSDSEKNKLLAEYNINERELPKVLITDPAIAKLNVKVGDVIKIERESQTAGVTTYYRIVMGG